MPSPSNRSLLVLALVGGVSWTPAFATADDGPRTEFSGWFETGLPDEKLPVVAKVTVTNGKQWADWKTAVPKLVPGESTRIDTPNDDPVLTTKIDWSKSMVVVVRSHDMQPTIVAVEPFAPDKGRPPLTIVRYELRKDYSARPAKWGFYAARIVPRAEGRVVYRVTRPKLE